MNDVMIIAEIGVNHNGSLERAIKMIDEAAASGVDVVKFQTFKSKNLVTKDAALADYQSKNVGKSMSQQSMLASLELSQEDFVVLKNHCVLRNVEFLSTAFDDESIQMLAEMHPKRWKVPSGELTNTPYLRKLGSFAHPIIVSTGMAKLSEIEHAVDVLLDAGLKRDMITLLHCTTEYPAPIAEVNLLAMKSMASTFQLPIGYSDHTDGIAVSLAAVALGAVVVEKHFTLDRQMEGPDHAASLEPAELRQMVSGIRDVQQAMGHGLKRPTASELKNRLVARKSLVAKSTIQRGEFFSESNLTCKRPGHGVSPIFWDDYIGRAATRHYEKDELIEP